MHSTAPVATRTTSWRCLYDAGLLADAGLEVPHELGWVLPQHVEHKGVVGGIVHRRDEQRLHEVQALVATACVNMRVRRRPGSCPHQYLAKLRLTWIKSSEWSR